MSCETHACRDMVVLARKVGKQTSRQSGGRVGREVQLVCLRARRAGYEARHYFTSSPACRCGDARKPRGRRTGGSPCKGDWRCMGSVAEDKRMAQTAWGAKGGGWGPCSSCHGIRGGGGGGPGMPGSWCLCASTALPRVTHLKLLPRGQGPGSWPPVTPSCRQQTLRPERQQGNFTTE